MGGVFLNFSEISLAINSYEYTDGKRALFVFVGYKSCIADNTIDSEKYQLWVMREDALFLFNSLYW
jgi:hypothetical protein